MARLDDFNSYLHDWEERKENVGRNFTYGSALYDGVREGHLDLSEFEWEINDYIEGESGARKDWVEDLSDEVKAEILDISYLDELVRDKYEQAQEEQQEELFDELDDNGPYKTRDDLETEVGRILDDYEYIDKFLGNVCDEYEEDRGIDYDEQLYEELDSFSFVSKSEVVGAIENYFYPSDGEESPSYGELAEYEQIAEDYIADRNLEFNEEENEETI